MAMESACKLQVGKDRYEGKVRMEADHIDFAGGTKFRFRLAETRNPERDNQTISFNFHGHPVSIELSSPQAAERWIDYILHPRTLAEKLGVKEGSTVRVANLDDSELLTSLASRKAKLVTDTQAACDVVLLGVERASELRQLEHLSENLKNEGSIWVVLQKTLRTVTKANVHSAVREAGLAYLGSVDYSETQAAHHVARSKKRASTNGGSLSPVRAGSAG
jgi:hypothetical protein